MNLIYSINGKDFKDYGVYVSESNGLIGGLKPKQRKSHDWSEYHGKVIDVSPVKYEEREIELQCWMKSNNWFDLKKNFDEIFSEFDKGGLVRLVVDFEKTLVFDVYLSEQIAIKNRMVNQENIATFTLKVKEPNPIKKVIKVTSANFNVSFNTDDNVNIKTDISVQMKGKVNYSRNLKLGSYVVVSGNIDGITGFKTNGKIIWEKI